MRIGITTFLPGLPQSPSIGLKSVYKKSLSEPRPWGSGIAPVCCIAGTRSLTVAARFVATLLKQPARPTVSGLQGLCCTGQTPAGEGAWSGAVG